MKKYLLIFQTAPYHGTTAMEGLEMALGIAAFNQQVSILFTDNGILQLLPQQSAEVIAFKDFTKAYKGLDLFDIKDVYLDAESLKLYNLEADKLLLNHTIVDTQQINALINQHQIVLTF